MKSKKTLVLILGCVAVFTFALLVFLGVQAARMYMAVKDSQHSIPFNSDTWKKPSGDDLWLRGNMLRDLTRKHKLVGMGRDEIIELLGDGAINPPGKVNEHSLVYKLNPYFLDYWWLVVDFDDNGRCVDYRTEHD